ncbi:Lysine-2,3-aminomutase family [Penicillium griseofulvum]|uniref:Lysine-2,3-aminomutase family n=1 Tax=Penicillium patulum TaxID=5078 RepID=A0A135LB04_PENPA|nr:Lysine-2,3-aminomutase family [Penicillium griseofulvum]KXG46134.1 Lysine-2,3-aminomutase family [Penicillium griseofulvum]
MASGQVTTQEAFLSDVAAGMQRAPMATRLTPHTLALVAWDKPYSDPIRRQFIPLASSLHPDHPQLQLDSLHENRDSPVKGLVHRYPDKVLFLASSVCPVYCRFCTRSYSVGAKTETVSKKRFLPLQKYWEPMFEYIAQTTAVTDVVVSGGDSFFLEPAQLREIGHRLLGIENVRRIRFASKGLAVCPSRILDRSDRWTGELIEISQLARKRGKSVALHTHFNHPQEISWITEQAAQRLFENAVTVRNQTVLLNGVNNDVDTMKSLIRRLADNNIQPYYVYQGDMVQGVEDLRTPLCDILHIESHVRGTIAGFMTPSFVVDLPGGGGKRLAATFDSYNRNTGVSTFVAPGVKGNTIHEYHDPLWSLPG